MGICKADDGCDYVENDSAFRKFMSQIFNDTFMKKYTRFDDWSGFQYSSAVFVNWKPPIAAKAGAIATPGADPDSILAR